MAIEIPYETGDVITCTCADANGISAGDIVEIASTTEVTSARTQITDVLLVQKATGSGNEIGVALTDADNGEKVTVLLRGIVKVQAGAAITVGAAVKVDANGKVVPVDFAGGDHANVVFGKALTPCDAADDYVIIQIGAI